MNNVTSLMQTLFGRISRIPLWIRVGALIILVTMGWLLYHNVAGGGAKEPQYITSPVEKGSIISTLSGSGSVTSETQVEVTSPTDGVVTNVYVKNGEEVTAGTPLFNVTSTATPEQKATAYASYLSAQNAVNAAQAKMNSLQATLFKANQEFVTGKGTADPDTNDPVYVQERATWLQAEADYNNQAGVIAQTQAAYNSASLAYQATQNATVIAPSNGTVANFSAQPGTVVSASGGSSTNDADTENASGTPLLILGNFSDLIITMQVSEIDVTKIKTGQKATITIDALPEQTFVGSVSSVDTVGTSSSGVVTYNAYVHLISPPETIKPGMTTTVMVQLQKKDNVLKVPSAAVQASNGESSVRIMKNGNVTSVPVTVGISSDSEIEILSGVSEGQIIVTSTSNPATGSSTTSSPFNATRGMGGGAAGGAVMIRRGN